MSGSVEHIHLAAERSGPNEPVDEAVADAGLGLRGDRHHGRPNANDLTLIEAEALERLAAERDVTLAPGGSRRNLTTRGLDLGALVGRRFRVGETLCEGAERCEPCLHLTRVTGEPGVLRGLVHTGLEAAIIEGGTIRVGDVVEPVD
jgi:MOSC domain-containing protein YiiM